MEQHQRRYDGLRRRPCVTESFPGDPHRCDACGNEGSGQESDEGHDEERHSRHPGPSAAVASAEMIIRVEVLAQILVVAHALDQSLELGADLHEEVA